MRRALEEALLLPPADRLESLYPVDETTAGDFCRWTIERLKLPSVRFCGNENKRVRSVAVLNGGEGITRTADCMQAVLRQAPDLILCGETDEYPQWTVRDLGIPMLEIGHTNSDNLGLERFAAALQVWAPEVETIFYLVERPWRCF